jgi:5-methylcytosine-specific restriction enzyme subunit McrC
MLLYAWDMAQWRDTARVQAEDAPHLLGLLARVLVATTQHLLRQQLGRAHRQTTAEIQGIRGHLDFGSSLRHRSFEAGRAVCRFPELSVDTLKNQILRSTMQVLVHDPRLGPGADKIHVTHIRHDLQATVRAMDGVSIIKVSGTDFAQVQLGQGERAYRLPLKICELIHELQAPCETEGDALLTALARDEMKLNLVFEAFVRNFYRQHLGGHVVERETLSWPILEASDRIPGMLTDITISDRQPPYNRTIIDTKFYASALATNPFGQARFHSANLYQLYAYLRTQEERGGSHRTTRGMLIYPTTDIELDDRLHLQGHEVRIVTLNLAAQWSEIESRLLEWFLPKTAVLLS